MQFTCVSCFCNSSSLDKAHKACCRSIQLVNVHRECVRFNSGWTSCMMRWYTEQANANSTAYMLPKHTRGWCATNMRSTQHTVRLKCDAVVDSKSSCLLRNVMSVKRTGGQHIPGVRNTRYSVFMRHTFQGKAYSCIMSIEHVAQTYSWLTIIITHTLHAVFFSLHALVSGSYNGYSNDAQHSRIDLHRARSACRV